ncbi:MAG TPA: hypothetical protein VMU04_04670 [Candidatus Acidoferrum sp.]|nr:hypothetical protein [Candidatus Acidoferrum sp.]
MKIRLACALALGFLLPCAVNAQIPTAGSPTGLNAAFVKLFGNVSAFSARLDTQVLDSSDKEWVRMPMQFAALDNKVRMDINLEQTVSRDLPASMISGLKNAGMERIVSIFRPDKQITYVLYPGSKRYMTMAVAKGETEAMQKGLKVEKTAVGKEKIDGHACVKNKVVIKNDQGPVLEAVTWNAADLQDLPVQIETKEKDKRVIMRFSQVQFAKPDAKQFEVPADYTLMQ